MNVLIQNENAPFGEIHQEDPKCWQILEKKFKKSNKSCVCTVALEVQSTSPKETAAGRASQSKVVMVHIHTHTHTIVFTAYTDNANALLRCMK